MSLRSLLRFLKRREAEQIINNLRSMKIHSYCVKNQEMYVAKPLINKYSSTCPAKCWNCKFPYKSELFCSQCKTLQKPPENLNYFDLIGVKEDYDIHIEDVQKKYRQLQTMLHPDRFGNRSQKEKTISENFSALLNKAYSTLLNPLDRGLYMLKLYDTSISEETTSLNPEFLMTIMDKNEQVESASGDKDKVLNLIKENKQVLEALTKKISEAFHDVDVERAKELLSQMKYYTSINNRLKKLKDELGILE